MLVNVIKLEEELTAYLAGVLHLEVDQTIFRGNLPERVSNAVAVRIDSEIKSNSLNFPTYNVQVIGKFDNRDNAWVLLSKMSTLAPAYGIDLPGFVLVSFTARGDGVGPYTDTDQSKVKQFASFNAIISILTKQA